MAYGKVVIRDYQDGSFIYAVIYGRTPAGSGLTKGWNYHNKRLVFEVPGLYWRNIHKIEVVKA